MPDGVRYEGIFGAANEQSSDRAAAPSGLAMYARSAKVARSPSAMAERRREVDAVRSDAPPAALAANVRTKLTPRLAQFLESDRGAAEPWLRLTITVTDDSAATIRALESTGLRVVAAAGRTVTGVIDRARLAELAANPAVVSIDVAPPPPAR